MRDSVLRISDRVVIPMSELRFRTSRSGGPGGQHVNKVETKVDVLFDVRKSPSLTPDQRQVVLDHLATRIDSSGVLSVSAQRSRSQHQNKEFAVDRLISLLQKALTPRSKRIPTRRTTGANERRIQAKKRTGEKKNARRSMME